MNKRGAAVIAALSLLLAGAADDARAGGYLSCHTYDPLSFSRSVEHAAPYPAEGTLRAGVVPHHLLAGGLIASFFATAAHSGAEYETVVLAAPSHYPTNQKAVTSFSGWRTAFGVVENDRAVTGRLIDSGGIGAKVDDANMQLDHAVSSLIPYVKYYLPQAKVSMVLLQNKLDGGRVRALAEGIYAAGQNKSILFVCSVDFSHSLMPDEAALRDEQTRRAIETFDYSAIAGFRDGNMDSPQAMASFLWYAQKMGIQKIQFLDHSSADQILKTPLTDPAYREGVTTYFILGAGSPS